MAEMAVALVAQAARPHAGAPRPDDPAAALDLLRQDLDYLETRHHDAARRKIDACVERS